MTQFRSQYAKQQDMTRQHLLKVTVVSRFHELHGDFLWKPIVTKMFIKPEVLLSCSQQPNKPSSNPISLIFSSVTFSYVQNYNFARGSVWV
jgi:hypothetical protein